MICFLRAERLGHGGEQRHRQWNGQPIAFCRAISNIALNLSHLNTRYFVHLPLLEVNSRGVRRISGIKSFVVTKYHKIQAK